MELLRWVKACEIRNHIKHIWRSLVTFGISYQIFCVGMHLMNDLWIVSWLLRQNFGFSLFSKTVSDSEYNKMLATLEYLAEFYPLYIVV